MAMAKASNHCSIREVDRRGQQHLINMPLFGSKLTVEICCRRKHLVQRRAGFRSEREEACANDTEDMDVRGRVLVTKGLLQ